MPFTAGQTIGDAPCAFCGHVGPTRVNKRGHLYHYCPEAYDGGCGIGAQCRKEAGDVQLAKRIKKWRDQKHKVHFLGGDTPDVDPGPAPKGKAEKPKEKSEPEPETVPDEVPEKSGGYNDDDPFNFE